MMKRSLFAIVAAGLTVGLVLPGYAQMMGGMMQGGAAGAAPSMGRMMGGSQGSMHRGHRGMAHPHEAPQITLMLHHSRELGLNPDQERKLRDLRTEFEKDSVRKSAEIRVAEIELNALLEQERWDMAKIEAAAKQIAVLQADLRVARLKTIAQGRAVLTPDQLQKHQDLGHRTEPAGGHGSMRQGMGTPGAGGSRPAVPGQGSPAAGAHQH